MDLDDRIDALYALPLSGFIPARDELAKALRREGDREAADRIKKLRKPSIPAWLLNQLQRREPDVIARLRDAGHQLLVCSQRGRGDDYASAAEAHREAHVEVVRRALKLADAAGLPMSPLQRDRLQESVRNLAAWGRREPPEPPGRLVGEIEAPPLELLLEEAAEPRQVRPSPSPTAPNREPERAPPSTDPERAEAEAKVRWLELRLARVERARSEKAGEHEVATDDLQVRLGLVERLEQEVAELEELAAHARQRAETERAAADEARGRAEAAAAELADLDRELAGLQTELDRARSALR